MMTKYTYTPSSRLLSTHEKERISWAEALESGKFTQHTGSWCGEEDSQNNESCCLHVLACVVLNNGEWQHNSVMSDVENQNTMVTHMIDAVAAERSGRQYNFVALNDDEHFTFDQIAQIIRGNPVTIEREIRGVK